MSSAGIKSGHIKKKTFAGKNSSIVFCFVLQTSLTQRSVIRNALRHSKKQLHCIHSAPNSSKFHPQSAWYEFFCFYPAW